jgi:predicted DNA-binding transcriptional regulator AlpA
MSDSDSILLPDEVATTYKIERRTLDQWRYLGKGPAYIKVGKHVRYRRADVEAWLAAQTVNPAA